MNTHHAYSLLFPQVDTLVFFPQLDHLNDNLISATWGMRGVMRGLGCSMWLVGLPISIWQLRARWRLAVWILWQQCSQLKDSEAGNKVCAHQCGVGTGWLELPERWWGTVSGMLYLDTPGTALLYLWHSRNHKVTAAGKEVCLWSSDISSQDRRGNGALQ